MKDCNKTKHNNVSKENFKYSFFFFISQMQQVTTTTYNNKVVKILASKLSQTANGKSFTNKIILFINQTNHCVNLPSQVPMKGIQLREIIAISRYKIRLDKGTAMILVRINKLGN